MPGTQKHREVIFYQDYFEEFFLEQNEKVRKKIIWTLRLIEELPVIPSQYLKSIKNSDGLFEIRVQQGNNIFRIFCFFDKGNVVVLANAFQKKTQKTPPNEIQLAERIKKAYENAKK
jgi:phage-related protein